MKLILAWLAPAKSRTDNVSGVCRALTNCSNPLLCLANEAAPLREVEGGVFEATRPLPERGVRSAEAGSLDVFRNRSHKEGHPLISRKGRPAGVSRLFRLLS
jgi:hypothetical protein